MKAYLLQVLVVDDNYLGLDEVVRVFEEDTDYRDSIEPHVISTQSIEVEGDLVQTEDIARLFSAWQPIATAPKDGTVFLGYKLFLGGTDYPVPMKFLKEYSQFVNIADGYAIFVCDVSHWMPMPNPPQARC